MQGTTVRNWVSVQTPGGTAVCGGVHRINVQGGVDLITRYHALRAEG